MTTFLWKGFFFCTYMVSKMTSVPQLRLVKWVKFCQVWSGQLQRSSWAKVGIMMIFGQVMSCWVKWCEVKQGQEVMLNQVRWGEVGKSTWIKVDKKVKFGQVKSIWVKWGQFGSSEVKQGRKVMFGYYRLLLLSNNNINEVDFNRAF